jgi:uncharacterized membrane protein HdeD (DUF308 family)
MARSRSRSSTHSPLALVLFVGAFTLFNAALTWLLLVAPFARWVDARDWVQTPCVVEQFDLASMASLKRGDAESSRIRLTFIYRFDGKEYRSNRHSIMSGFLTGSLGLKSLIGRHPSGMKTVCYVNAANPWEALLDRSTSSYMLLGLIPLLFSLTGVLWFVALKRQRSSPSR